MTLFHQFSVFAASRGEGLHPKLRALFERADASPFSEVSMRRGGMIQAGPSPDSEVVSSRVNVTPFSRELARSAIARNETVPISWLVKPGPGNNSCALADPGQQPPRAGARHEDGRILRAR